jgi:signal transduction histidine kinase
MENLSRAATEFGVAVIIWLLIALLTSVQTYAAPHMAGNPQSWRQTISASLPWYGVWALLTPAIVWMARRFDLYGAARPKNLIIHGCVGLIFAVAQAGFYALIAGLLNRDNPNFPKTMDLVAIKLSGGLHINLMIYALIVGLIGLGRAYAALHDREITSARLKAQLAEAETSALRAQLQPHFLFNALNSIASAAHSDPVTAVRMTARLGDLLRLSIDGPRSPVATVAEELDFTEAYLAIESERLGERLRIVRDIEPAARTAKIPSLLLQPLVENSVRHGLAPLARGGEIILRARLVGRSVQLVISDNGLGAHEIKEGIGIGNARQRLRQLYGENHLFTIEAKPNLGFTVRIEVPQ